MLNVVACRFDAVLKKMKYIMVIKYIVLYFCKEKKFIASIIGFDTCWDMSLQLFIFTGIPVGKEISSV